jgi:drug/metabolite transporter (DMT)-like permease
MAKFDIIKTLSQTNYTFQKLKALNPLMIRKRGRKTKAIFALSLVCFLWGTTWIGSHEGVKYIPALQMAGIRQFLGGFTYVLFFLVKKSPLPRGKEWIPILILSVLNFSITNGFAIWGVQYISAGLGAIIGAIFPLWLVVIGLFSSKQKLPAKAIGGLLLGFTGICIVFYGHLADFFNADFRFGIIVSLIATLTWALGTIITKQQASNFNPYFSLGLQMLISGISLLGLTKAIHSDSIKTFIPISEIPLNAWIAIIYLVVFGSWIAFVAYIYALQNLPTGQVSVYAYINPLVAVLIGWIMFDESVTISLIIGGIVALIGVYIVNRTFKTVPPAEQPETEGV